jgi:hypothetical protein
LRRNLDSDMVSREVARLADMALYTRTFGTPPREATNAQGKR